VGAHKQALGVPVAKMKAMGQPTDVRVWIAGKTILEGEVV